MALSAMGAGYAFWKYQQSGDVFNLSSASDYVNDAALPVASFLDGVTMGALNLSGMKKATAAMLQYRNVRAFLLMIRVGEGTSDANGYKRIFGGQLFSSFADHPRITVKASGYTSSAAGAYQFLASTWDETKRAMGLKDFSPESQDLAALGRIAARGAMDDVISGNFDTAVKKCAKEWASLPYSPYGQPTQSIQAALGVYLKNGGALA